MLFRASMPYFVIYNACLNHDINTRNSIFYVNEQSSKLLFV